MREEQSRKEKNGTRPEIVHRHHEEDNSMHMVR